MPLPRAGELLVKVHSNALCGSDRRAYERGADVTPGHEVSGTVEALGEGVEGPVPGTSGVVYLVAFCGRCSSCQAGATNLCLDRAAMYGFTAAGGLADFVCVRASCFLPVDGVALGPATALLDLFGTTMHALRRAGPLAGRRVGVLGCGPIGLGAITAAVALGASSVHAVDVSAARLRLAAAAGASVFDGRDGDVIGALRDAAGGGFDVVFEAAGLAQTQRQALALAAPGASVLVVAHSRTPLELQTSADLIARELALVGCEYFRVDEHAETLARVRDGTLDPAPLITHSYPLEQVEEACSRFFAGETGKVLVQP